MRRKVFAELFDTIIDNDDTYGHLLRRIKEEYETDSGGGGGGKGGESSAYVELNVELQTLKRAMSKSNNENMQLGQDIEVLRKECVQRLSNEEKLEASQ